MQNLFVFISFFFISSKFFSTRQVYDILFHLTPLKKSKYIKIYMQVYSFTMFFFNSLHLLYSWFLLSGIEDTLFVFYRTSDSWIYSQFSCFWLTDIVAPCLRLFWLLHRILFQHLPSYHLSKVSSHTAQLCHINFFRLSSPHQS